MSDTAAILTIDEIVALLDRPRGGIAASREFDRRVPRERQPVWAARFVERLQSRHPRLPEVDLIVAVAHDPGRWSQASAAFESLRRLTLAIEQSDDRSSEGFLVMAEDLAKAIANAVADDDDSSFRPGRALAVALSARTLAEDSGDEDLIRDIEQFMQTR